MPDDIGERKQWHPVLVDGLRYLFGSALEIEPEHPLALLPTRVDVLAIRRGSTEELAYPYNLMGQTTLVKLVTPGEWVTWRELCKLCADGLLYRLCEDIEDFRGSALWLVTSRMSDGFVAGLAEQLGGVEPAGPGLWQARHMGTPVVVVHLHELPITVDALPLLMTYKGPREAEIAECAVECGRQFPLFLEQATAFHAHAVREAIEMIGNPETYRNLANVKDIVYLFGPKALIEEIGEEAAIRAIGEEAAIRAIGEERVLDDLIRALGPDRVRELLDAKIREGRAPGKPATE